MKNTLQKHILKKLDSMEEKLSTKLDPLDKYISEQAAKQRFKKGTTWFWNLRNKKGFPYTKLGGEVFYAVADLINYLDSNKKGGHDD